MINERSTFRLICGLSTVIAVLFILLNIAIITFRGIGSLPECLAEEETRFAIVLSLRSATISSILCFLLAIPTAYTLTRNRSVFNSIAEIILEVTMSLPYIVLGLSMLILFSSPVGKSLKAMGFPVVLSSNGVILAQLIVNLPFAIKLCSTAFSGINRKVLNVAGLLGATEGKRFFSILLPLCRNTLISALILVWSRALGEFGATLMLVGVTRMKTETLPASIYLNVSTNDLGMALSSAFILLVISAISLGAASILTRLGKGYEYGR